MIGKLIQVAILSGDQKIIQLWSEYDEMKRLKKEAAQDREVTGLERPRNALVKATLKLFEAQLEKHFIGPEIFENAINLEQKNKWHEDRKLNEIKTWDLVLKEKGQNIIHCRCVFKFKHFSK